MSTRCQIDFIRLDTYEDEKNKKRVWKEHTRIYHHYDGTPDNIIPELTKFFKWNNGFKDGEYTPANFIFWAKLRDVHEDNCRQDKPDKIITINKILLHPKDINSNHLPTGSYGISNNKEIHGDLNYFYEVIYKVSEPKTITVKCYKLSRDGRPIKKLDGEKAKLIKTELIKIQ